MSSPNTPDHYESMMRSFAPMDATEAFHRLQGLVQRMPNLIAIQEDRGTPPETLKWLGQLHAVVGAMKRLADAAGLSAAMDNLARTHGMRGAPEITAILYRALAAAELAAPASEQGAFIAVGAELDAYAAISKPLSAGKKDVLIVDPYMDASALMDFGTSTNEGVTLRVLTDAAGVKPNLYPAANKWTSQFGSARPLEVRVATARALHDRLIVVDGSEVWSLTQSLKDFANRSPGSVLKVNAETAALKVGAYAALWDQASPIA